MHNEIFGWALVFVGFCSGAVLGVGFKDDSWLGGYSSLRRRMARLAHIACCALGGLNVVFASSVRGLQGADSVSTAASIAFILGGAAMPVACLLYAWRQQLYPAFFVPVCSLLFGAGAIIYGLCGAVAKGQVHP